MTFFFSYKSSSGYKIRCNSERLGDYLPLYFDLGLRTRTCRSELQKVLTVPRI